jgi:hypothetical protein
VLNLSANLRFGRLFLLLLAIFTVGRWTLGLKSVPYEKGSPVFSLLILTILSSLYYAAFARRFKGYTMLQAVALAMTFAFVTQLVILLSTLASYLAGVDSYFNHPAALNAQARLELPQAMVLRSFGLVFNTLVIGSITGALGWAMGAVLPEK